MEATQQRPLKIGIFLPYPEQEPATARWRDLKVMVQRAEEVGFDSIWVGDHLLCRFDAPNEWTRGSTVVGPWECWSLLAGLAAVTQRVELGPLVTSTSFRNPALLAKMADTVDEISNGRLILGLGAGWHEPEYRAFGYPFDHRVGRFEEALTIIHTLLRQGHVDFNGTYYQVRDCELRPRGPRPAGPPLLIGTTGVRMLRLAAHYADMWNGWLVGRSHPDEVPALQTSVDAACQAVGRDPATLIGTATVVVDMQGQNDCPFPASITGTPEEVATTLRAFTQHGIAHIQIVLHPGTLAGVEAFRPVLEILHQTYLAERAS